MNTKCWLVVLCLWVSFNNAYAQSSVSEQYIWFDSQVSLANTNLYNGERYIERFRSEPGQHKFYNQDQFVTGSLSFKGELYYNIALKYNIFQDELIANIFDKTGESIITLNKSYIDKFFIYNNQFVQINDTKDELVLSGFYELSFEGEALELYIKYFKHQKEYIKNKSLFYKYLPKDSFYVKHRDKWIKLNKKSDLLKLVPQYKKEINATYKQFQKTQKRDRVKAVKSIINQLNQTIANQ